MVNVHVAIINLVCRPSRRRRILALAERLLRHSVSSTLEVKSINLIEAVDGVQNSFSDLELQHGLVPFAHWALPDPDNKFPSSWRVPQTSGGIASGLSHLDVARWATKMYADSDDLVLVMEDDCVIGNSLDQVWAFFESCVFDAKKFQPNWHMLLLGASSPRADICPPIPIPGSSVIEQAGFSYLTTMYFLSAKGARYLDSRRAICLANGLAFDELHNALAGLNKVRSDVLEIFAPHSLIMLSSTQSFVKQDPFDCVHDTAVSSKARRALDVVPPYKELVLIPHKMERAVWWRRERIENICEFDKLRKRFGKRGFLEQLLAARKLTLSPEKSFPSSFDVYYKAKQKRRYGPDLPQNILFRDG